MINEASLLTALQHSEPEKNELQDILDKAYELQGLSLAEAATLAAIRQPEALEALFQTANKAKETIYGRRLVLFAPLYISNLCKNDCTYCAFRAQNTTLKRRALNADEIARETKILVEQGHKRVLLVSGESLPAEGLDYVLQAIDAVYSVKSERGEIRRINVNIAPLETEDFKRLLGAHIGTYQIFQETYHRETYAKVHPRGKKADYDWRLSALHRAMEAGIDDVGIGALFGLYDWRFELLALLEHAAALEKSFGVGPHTISVPRMEPASGSQISADPPYALSDTDFYKLIAILRLAVPYTGIILSTRETAEVRRKAFDLGVSQISAGSRTNPGGYQATEEDCAQFSLGDHRSLDEVIRDVASHGYIPSFCTACYRLGRTGADFMDLAKPGLIKKHCDPNALSTFQEFLLDYASPETRKVGEELIERMVSELQDEPHTIASRLLHQVCENERDVFV